MSEQSIPQQEFGTRPEDILAFTEAMDAIDAHNSEFSMGKLMARALLQHTDKQDRIQGLVDAGATESEAEETVDFVGDESMPMTKEEQMARSVVGITNAPVLESTGLALSPLRTTATMYSEGGEQKVGQVRLQVTDGSRFSGFLQTVNPESVDDKFKGSVTKVVRSVVSEARMAITHDVEEATAHETLAYGQGIVTGLERIGLGDEDITGELRQLYKHAQNGDVKEFVLANTKQLLTTPDEQGFGPAQWQRDASPEFLASHWKEVVDILKMTKANPKATELYQQMLESVRTSLDFAVNDWAKLKADGYAGDGYNDGFEGIFEATRLELDLLDSPDELVE
jgi:hypothetical protein